MFGRREFLQFGGGAVSLALTSGAALAEAVYSPAPGAWRGFEVTTRLELGKAKSPARAWIPLPSFAASDWMYPLGDRWTTNAKHARVVGERRYGARLLHLVWGEADAAPVVELVSRAQTRDRAAAPRAMILSEADRKLYTSATVLIPVDGIVKETSDKIVAGANSDEAKARAIYDWLVEHAYRKAETRGCGVGDIVAMLKTGDLGGKCADINALYVGLARAAGLPARDIYGLRVAPSRFGYKSLGVNAANITKAQHCRAEVFIAGLGWTPVDPADVRKVMLEEPPGGLPLGDDKVAAARKALFGGSEGNWIAYNSGHDLALPGASAPRIDFLMYPQAEIAGARLDCLDPDRFRYAITAKELTA